MRISEQEMYHRCQDKNGYRSPRQSKLHEDAQSHSAQCLKARSACGSEVIVPAYRLSAKEPCSKSDKEPQGWQQDHPDQCDHYRDEDRAARYPGSSQMRV